VWPEENWREEYYKLSEKSKAIKQRNPYHILGVEPISPHNMSIYTATQVNVSNFNSLNVVEHSVYPVFYFDFLLFLSILCSLP
jgi:hypothetical protein